MKNVRISTAGRLLLESNKQLKMILIHLLNSRFHYLLYLETQEKAYTHYLSKYNIIMLSDRRIILQQQLTKLLPLDNFSSYKTLLGI